MREQRRVDVRAPVRLSITFAGGERSRFALRLRTSCPRPFVEFLDGERRGSAPRRTAATPGAVPQLLEQARSGKPAPVAGSEPSRMTSPVYVVRFPPWNRALDPARPGGKEKSWARVLKARNAMLRRTRSRKPQRRTIVVDFWPVPRLGRGGRGEGKRSACRGMAAYQASAPSGLGNGIGESVVDRSVVFQDDLFERGTRRRLRRHESRRSGTPQARLGRDSTKSGLLDGSCG